MRSPCGILLVVLFSATVLGCFGDSWVGVGGQVVDEEGKPISDVTYTLMTSGKPDPRFPEYSHPSSPNGTFDATAPNGEFGCNQPKMPDFIVRFEKEGYITKTVPCPGDDSHGIIVILTKDKKRQAEGEGK